MKLFLAPFALLATLASLLTTRAALNATLDAVGAISKARLAKLNATLDAVGATSKASTETPATVEAIEAGMMMATMEIEAMMMRFDKAATETIATLEIEAARMMRDKRDKFVTETTTTMEIVPVVTMPDKVVTETTATMEAIEAAMMMPDKVVTETTATMEIEAAMMMRDKAMLQAITETTARVDAIVEVTIFLFKISMMTTVNYYCLLRLLRSVSHSPIYKWK